MMDDRTNLPMYTGSRFNSGYDFGMVTFDILGSYQRDSGIYTCRAKNNHGEAFTSTTIICTGQHTEPPISFLLLLHACMMAINKSRSNRVRIFTYNL